MWRLSATLEQQVPKSARVHVSRLAATVLARKEKKKKIQPKKLTSPSTSKMRLPLGFSKCLLGHIHPSDLVALARSLCSEHPCVLSLSCSVLHRKYLGGSKFCLKSTLFPAMPSALLKAFFFPFLFIQEPFKQKDEGSSLVST